MNMSYFNRISQAGLALMLSTCFMYGQGRDSLLYKQVDSTALYLYVDYPPEFDDSKIYPALVFFFGGGWIGGTPAHFAHQAGYFAQRGMICFRADYRVQSRHGTTPFESLKDAKSALRFVRAHAADLAVDPERIVASGGSAGGHLAAATALIDGFNEDGEDTAISSVPNALILFNPVMDNGPGGYGYDRVGDAYRFFSPLHNLNRGAPPTILFLGTEDDLIPVETAAYYKTVMEKVGSRCELFLYEGEKHGFFNYGNFDNYKKTVNEANRFLVSLGFIKEQPVIEIK
jgi:acetyl esterase/lipase